MTPHCVSPPPWLWARGSGEPTPQDSYRNEHGRTQPSRTVLSGSLKSKTGNSRKSKRSRSVFTGTSGISGKEQVRENNHASVRSQMELRTKDMECALFKAKPSRYSSRTELEKYKQLHLEELIVRNSLENKLNILRRTTERLPEMSATPLEDNGQNRTSRSTPTRRPALGTARAGNLTPRNTVVPTTNPWASDDTETFFAGGRRNWKRM